MSHAPGPWTVTVRSAHTGNYIVNESRGVEDDEANARLIAAAPELLYSLLAFNTPHQGNCFAPTTSGGQFGCMCDQKIQNARLALAKAGVKCLDISTGSGQEKATTP